MLRLVLTLVLAVCLFRSSEAGCYRKGVPRANIPLHLQSHNHEPVEVMKRDKLPKRFTWCDVDGINFCTASWNQHIPVYCGSCWVHGTLSMVQDRLKIAKGARGIDTMLGRQSFLNCAGYNKDYGEGCNGGEPPQVLKYMVDYGLPDESCQPYTATDHTSFENTTQCPPEAYCTNCMPKDDDPDDFVCWPVPTPVVYKVTRYGKVGKSEVEMMSEIYKRGPIVCSIATPEEFIYGYKNDVNHGIYVDKNNSSDVDHDVEVVGWGESHGTPYWIVRNSWGTYWGSMGFFKLKRGDNNLKIEDGDCWYAEVEYSMEKKVRHGELEGSMYGVKEGAHQEEGEGGHHQVVLGGEGGRQRMGIRVGRKAAIGKNEIRH